MVHEKQALSVICLLALSEGEGSNLLAWQVKLNEKVASLETW